MKVILELEVDKSQSEKSLQDYTKRVDELKTHTKILADENKRLAEAGEQNSDLYKENTKIMALHKDEISRTNTTIKNLVSVMNTEANTLDGLKARNKQIIEQRGKLNPLIREQKQEIDRLNAELDANNEILTENLSKQEKQRLEFGQVTAALDRLVPGLGGMTQNLKEATIASRAFISTPLGAILALLGLALVPVITYLRTTGDGMDIVDVQSARLKASIQVLTDEIAALGREIVNQITSEDSGLPGWAKALVNSNPLVLLFKYNVEALKLLFPQLTEEMKKQADIAEELAQRMDVLGDEEALYNIRASRTRNIIKEINLEAKNRTISEEDRIKKLREVIELEEKQNQVIVGIRFSQLQVVVDKFSQMQRVIDNIQRGEAESLEDFAERLARLRESGVLSDAESEEIAKALIALREAEGESITIREKAQTLIDQLKDQALLRDQKRAEQLAKINKEALEQQQKDMADALAELDKKRQEDLELRRLIEEDSKRIVGDIRRQETQEFKDEMDKQLEYFRESARKQESIERFKADTIATIEQASFVKNRGLRIAALAFFKKDAISETLTNTYNAAVAAYKSVVGIPVVGPVLAPIAAATASAFGLLNVARIAGVQFAKGGKVGLKQGTFKGRDHSHGGIDLYGTDGTHINVEGDENFYVLKKSASQKINSLSALNVAEGGRSFHDRPTFHAALGGQIETRQAINQPVNMVQLVDRTIKRTLEGVKLVVITEDIRSALTRTALVEDRANVL